MLRKERDEASTVVSFFSFICRKREEEKGRGRGKLGLPNTSKEKVRSATLSSFSAPRLREKGRTKKGHRSIERGEREKETREPERLSSIFYRTFLGKRRKRAQGKQS